MAQDIYPTAHFRPVVNKSAGIITPTRGLILHVQEGNGSPFGEFNNPATQKSSHLWLSKAGHFEQYVPFTMKAWAQKAGNTEWISCECEGRVGEDYTPIQSERLGELYAWGIRVFGWAAQVTDDPKGRGIGTHRMGGIAWGGHSCPGGLRAGRRQDILAAALGRQGTVDAAGNPSVGRFAGYPVLNKGDHDPGHTGSFPDRGNPVATLQNALNIVLRHEDHADPLRLGPDGQFGDRTYATLTSFQQWWGLATDGIAGPATWAGLDGALRLYG
ncbi:peptidoglycan recognition protein family protein, partial [Candidatus Protofrankia californiensis]|uniref:peptidoglycan recognition protein family protein n=1 Tax=Candidatus Protofrankia californiensis TaxID=1839754 RepID=UPI0010415135